MQELHTDTRYVRPGRMTAAMNWAVRGLVRLGVGVWGARELRLLGRKSGQLRTNVVNLLPLAGEQYLVAPRGTTEWVRNLRAAGGGELRLGRRVKSFRAAELDDDAKFLVLRAYLERWKWEVGQFFQGVGPDASDSDIARIAPDYPVFRIDVLS
jgi:deazaflavin-dependent oxidoreductase (nitroreductase family)